MDPVAARLATDHLRLAAAIGRRHHFPDDPGLGESVALEALCYGAQLWTERDMCGRFPAWVSRYICRRLIDELRRRYGRDIRPPRPLSLDAPTDEGTPLSDLLGINDPDPSDPFVCETLQDHVGGLTDRQLHVLRLLYEGRTLTQTAAVLGVTESAVWQVRSLIRRQFAGLDCR